jgi:hypothetical protein
MALTQANLATNAFSVPAFGVFDVSLENLRVGQKIKVTFNAIGANGQPLLNESYEGEIAVAAAAAARASD